jgi:hypothetical protein
MAKFTYKDYPQTKFILDTTIKNTLYIFKKFRERGGGSTSMFAKTLSKYGHKSEIGKERIEGILYNERFDVDVSRQIFEIKIWCAIADFAGVSLKVFMFDDLETYDKMLGIIR